MIPGLNITEKSVSISFGFGFSNTYFQSCKVFECFKFQNLNTNIEILLKVFLWFCKYFLKVFYTKFKYQQEINFTKFSQKGNKKYKFNSTINYET